MNTTSVSRGIPHTSMVLKRALVGGAAIGALLLGSAAFAQEEGTETVVVTGYRASLAGALNVKRTADTMVDAINAEDIAKFPDANLAEALQRLPGVAVDRDNGEGRTITVRGLGADFTRVTLNGLETLSTAGATSGAGDAPNRGRKFDFNTFASELFNSLKVQKSASADQEEGSLGATVQLFTPRPFDGGGETRLVLNAQNAYYEFGKPFNPRVSALASTTLFGGKVGVLVSAAYTSRSQFVDSYSHGAGQSDFVYRGSDFKWTGGSTSAGFNNVAGGLLGRNGFAAPSTAVCNGTIAPYYTGVVPGNNVTNVDYCNALRGSDPAAYALINTPQGWTITDTNTKTNGTSSLVTAPGSIVRFPALATIDHQQLYTRRIGLTGSVQWQANDDTLFTLDGLFSTVYNDSIHYSISPVGLNRNNTSTTLSTASASTSASSLTSLFYTCVPQVGTATQANINCTGTEGGTTLVPGTVNSYNPYNLDIYDYYTQAAYGYPNGKLDAINAAIKAVGRPSSQVIAAQMTNNNVDYLELNNVDFRSAADQVYYTTQFEQLSLNGQHSFSDRVRADITLGWSHSYNHQSGFLGEMNKLDSGSATGDGHYILDATGGGEMPALTYGFDVADPAEWDFVKGFSALRHYEYLVDNKYRTLIANLAWDMKDWITLRAGANLRIYDFWTAYYQRPMRDVLNPSFKELGVTSDEMGQVMNWGKGLSVPSGMPTSFFVPNLNAYKSAIGFDCNCINKYGDWTITNLFNPTSTGSSGQTYKVSEHSRSFYLQADFHNVMIFGNELRGNIGARLVTTEVSATGHALQGQELFASHSYNDLLPAVNVAYNLTDTMLIRVAAAKVMARPDLSLLAPSITSMSIKDGTSNSSGSTMTMGNTRLDPYRAKTFDIGWEWYFDKDAVLAVTGFAKWVSSNPQTVVTSGPLTNFLSADSIATIEGYYRNACVAETGGNLDCTGTGTVNVANLKPLTYLVNNYPFNTTMALNGSGGALKGLEITYQQPLDFIPAWFGGQGFGVNANYTHIIATQHYILNSVLVGTTTVNTMSDGNWPGASPDAFNFTLYYDADKWSGRVSAAYRSAYVSNYPIAGGTLPIGYDNSPMVADFEYSKNTLNIDASFNYDFSENIELNIDALNLTNQPDRRWAYVAAPETTRYASSGRQVFVGFRLKY